jgi:hypothetical protein
MKKFYLTLFAFFICGFSYAQMTDGNYTYKNAELTLSFTIAGDGWEIYNIVLTNTTNGRKENATGEWFKVNMNGVEEDYSGPEGWYQFQTDNCNYDFNEATNKLVLQKFDCAKNPGDSREYTLIRQY